MFPSTLGKCARIRLIIQIDMKKLYYCIFFSKRSSKRGLPITMMDDKHGSPIRNRSATADYPRPQPQKQMRERAPSAKLANKSLVSEINKKPTTPIPDVIASHESHSSSAHKKVNGEINSKDARAEFPSSQVNHTVAKVEEGYKASTSKINHSSSKLDSVGTVEDINVQVHSPASEVSVNNERTSSRWTDEADLVTNVEFNFLDYKEKTKRKSSFTHSEKEAVGTLDDVLQEFNDVDDNFEDVSPSEGKAIDVQPVTPDFDPTYEAMTDIKETLTQRDEVKPNGVYDNSNSNYNLTSSALQHKHSKNELVPPMQPEPVYAKPSKPINNTASKIDPGKLITPRSTRQEAPENPPVVPPKRFVVEKDHEHDIKFSPLRKTSPSASLSKSLNNTTWANANEIPSPKRKPVQDNNDNFSLKRGQLSGPAPISSDHSYVEPARDYDTNATLSSLATTTTDGSFNRDTWSSMTSSSTSGSRKVKKELRPEVLKMIEKRKVEKDEQKKIEGRQYDGLVNRSFRLRDTSLKERASKSSVKEDRATESEKESDYASIKNEADLWLEGYERMRASSEGKKESALKSRLDKRTIENGLPVAATLPLSQTTQAVLNQTDDQQVPNGTFATVATTNEMKQTRKVKKEKTTSESPLAQNEENDSSDDENLIRLMETGISPEYPTDPPLPQPERLGYVPRALRMSFGQNWDGIRKDRREWKSREMKQASAQASRKGGKTLSNRFDDQEVQLEMLF